MTPLVLQVSMGGGDRLPSGDPSARLPSYFIKTKNLINVNGYKIRVRHEKWMAFVKYDMNVKKGNPEITSDRDEWNH